MVIRRYHIMNYQTAEQLTELRLRAMRQEYLRQIELPAMGDLSFDDRFAMIVTAQVDARHTSRINRLLKKAELRDPSASLANIDFDEKRRLPKPLIMQLSDCIKAELRIILRNVELVLKFSCHGCAAHGLESIYG